MPATAADTTISPDPVSAWCYRITRANESHEPRRLFDLLAAGPDDRSVPLSTASTCLNTLVPNDPSGDYLGANNSTETTAWDSSARSFVDTATKPTVSPREALRWARSHSSKAADLGGWSGRLLLDLYATDPIILTAFAALASTPPHRFHDLRARNAAYRLNSGVLLAREGKAPRPISAPSTFRKLASALDARRARTAAASYCEKRGQVGLSSPASLLCYSVYPRLVVAMGGSTVSADNTNSFQRFSRQGLLAGALAFLTDAAALEHPAAACAAARLFDSCIFDSSTHMMHRTNLTTFRRFHLSCTSHGLSQGCSSSPTLEAITLATAPSSPSAHSLTLRRSAHDDFQATGLPGCTVESLAPPPPFGGSAYNHSKAVAVGPLAASIVVCRSCLHDRNILLCLRTPRR
ncbi:MAG: hypothetical protein ACK559_24715 [bacterium]